jgi:hypothetical protein
MVQQKYIDLYTNEYKDTYVIPFDKEKIDAAINHSLWHDKAPNEFYQTLDIRGYIGGTKLLLDNEAVHEILESDSVNFDVYKYTKNDEGQTISQEMIPSVRMKVTLVSILQNYCLEAVTLQEFMGDRFCYNSRILSNLHILKDSIKAFSI